RDSTDNYCATEQPGGVRGGHRVAYRRHSEQCIALLPVAAGQREVPDEPDRRAEYLPLTDWHVDAKQVQSGEYRSGLTTREQRCRHGNQFTSFPDNSAVASRHHSATCEPNRLCGPECDSEDGGRGKPTTDLPLAERRFQFERWRQHRGLVHEHTHVEQR